MKPTYYLTAYGIACKHGFKGTEEEWLNSLTAFYLAQQAGYEGTVDEWLRILNDPVPAITIGEVTTLEGGSDATVTITGDKYHPVLNFAIPRGMSMVDALALQGGTMKGSINMDGNAVTGLPDPENETDAANRNYVDTTAKDVMKLAAQKTSKANLSVTLRANDWADHEQTVAAEDVTADENETDIFITAAPESYVAYAENMIRCTSQGENSLTFTCTDVPAEDVKVNVIIFT